MVWQKTADLWCYITRHAYTRTLVYVYAYVCGTHMIFIRIRGAHTLSILLNGKPICEHFSSQRSRRLIPGVSRVDTHRRTYYNILSFTMRYANVTTSSPSYLVGVKEKEEKNSRTASFEHAWYRISILDMIGVLTTPGEIFIWILSNYTRYAVHKHGWIWQLVLRI